MEGTLRRFALMRYSKHSLTHNNIARFGIMPVIVLLLVLSSCHEILEKSLSGQDRVPGREDDIPGYYYENNYLPERVSAIKNALGAESIADDKIAFFWITDMHWEKNYNTRLSPSLIRFISQATGIDVLLDGGDNGNAPKTCEDVVCHLTDALGSNHVYSVTGNHELLGAYEMDHPLKHVNTSLRSHNNDIVFGDDDGSYFYLDDHNKKLRYVGLSTFGSYNGEKYTSAYNLEQLEWFKNTALDVSSGWTIIIFTHSLYYVNIKTDKLGPSPAGAEDFISVIDNYDGKGEIACVLMGHSHRDRIHIGSSGVPYIISSCDRYSPYSIDGIPDINIERIPGTITEQHFEVVVMDTVNKEVLLLPIGANARDGYDDEKGNEVNLRKVSY